MFNQFIVKLMLSFPQQILFVSSLDLLIKLNKHKVLKLQLHL